MKTSLPTSVSITTGTIVRTVLVLIGFYILYLIVDILLVMLAAIVIASAVEPGTRWFTERKVPRVVGVLLIYLAAALLFFVSFYFLLLPLFKESVQFLQTLPEYSEALSQSESLEVGTFTPQGILGGISNSFSLAELVQEMNALVNDLSNSFLNMIQLVFGGMLSFLLIVVLSFYLAVQEDGVGKFLRIVTPVHLESYIVGLWTRSRRKIGLWMQGQLLLAVIVAVLVYLGLTLLGVPNPLLLAVLAGAFELIPLFGPVLSAIPAVLFAFADGGLTLALIVTGLFLIIQQFESQLIYPLVVKKVVGVPPIISILALVIGGKLAGFLGIILSVPVATFFIELLEDIERRKLAKE